MSSPYRKPIEIEESETPRPNVTLARVIVCVGLTLWLGQLVVLAVGCLGVASQDLNALQDAAKLNLAAYTHSEGGAERALERGAYCAVAGVLRRNDAGVPDGGAITCP